jgi:hypothetical protein
VKDHACDRHPGPSRACYSAHRCRCFGCRVANANYEYDRQRRNASGRSDLVDAAPVLEHLEQLRRAGVGRRQIAAAAGVSPTVLQKLLRTERPTRRVRRDTADRILAVDPTDAADGARIRARRTWVLVEEMLRTGWTRRDIARRLTGNADTLALQLGRRRVTAANARKVARLHADWIYGRLTCSTCGGPVSRGWDCAGCAKAAA